MKQKQIESTKFMVLEDNEIKVITGGEAKEQETASTTYPLGGGTVTIMQEVE